MKTFTQAGITIAYRDMGDGPAILFLHNGGTSSTIWRDQMAALSSEHRTLAVDLPGFGASPRSEPPVTLDDMVAVVIGLIEQEDLAPVTLVGNCMGSNISIRVSRARPDLVARVLAINPLTASSFGGGRIGFVHTMKRIAARPMQAARSASRRMPIPSVAGSSTLRFQLGRKGVAQGLHRDPELLACLTRPDQMPALVDVLEDMDAYGDLDTDVVDRDVPVWVVWGDQNRVLSRTRAAGLEQRLHAERVEILPDTGHLAMLEDPDTMTGLITEMIQNTAESATDRATESETEAASIR